MSDIKVSSQPAIGFVGLLTIVLVVLKALGYITWSWWWVFSPLWISAIAGVCIVVLCMIIAFFIVKNENKEFKRDVDKMTAKYVDFDQDKRFK